MKNTILNYELEELDEFIVSNYFSKNIDIYNLLNSLGEYLDIYQIQNSDKLERIAYELYGNTDFWDILLLLNDRNPLFEMPYEYDLLEDYALNRANYYKLVLYANAPLIQTRTDALMSEILSETVASNEEYRIIYIIKPEKMNNFISLLKANSYI
jgi:hypothetical protein